MDPGAGHRYTCVFWTLTLNAFICTAVYLSLCAVNIAECNGSFCSCAYIERYTLCSVIGFVLLVLWRCFKQKMKIDSEEHYLQPLPIFAEDSEFERRRRSTGNGNKRSRSREADMLKDIPRTSVPEDFECAICNESESTEPVSQLPCDHMFHRECLLRWFSADSKKTCPICRDSQLPSGRLIVITIIPQLRQSSATHRLATV